MVCLALNNMPEETVVPAEEVAAPVVEEVVAPVEEVPTEVVPETAPVVEETVAEVVPEPMVAQPRDAAF